MKIEKNLWFQHNLNITKSSYKITIKIYFKNLSIVKFVNRYIIPVDLKIIISDIIK